MRQQNFLRIAGLAALLFQAAVSAQAQGFGGTWVTSNADTNGLVRLQIRGSEIHAFWKCRPNPCDMGTASGDVYTSAVQGSPTAAIVARFRADFGQVMLTMMLLGDYKLQVDSFTHFVDVTRSDSLERQVFSLLDAKGIEDDPGFPKFPWPPPQWTTRIALKDSLVMTSPTDTLGRIFDRLVMALRRGSVEEWSSYGIGDDGFAIVSRLEHINDDGRPRPGAERWTTQPIPAKVGGLWSYLSALFTAKTGRYRIIVFAVTAKAVTSGKEEPTAEQMSSLLREGALGLPRSLSQKVVPSIHCEALVYEFFRASEDDPVRLVSSSRLLPTQHLAGAGLWKEDELR